MSWFVNTPSFEQAWGRLAACHASFRSQHGPQHLRILGQTGVGKTFLFKRYLAEHPRRALDDRDLIPVLLVPIPSTPTGKGVYAAILQAMGVANVGNATQEKLHDRVVTLIRNLGVEMLMLDEINHLVDRGRRRTHETVTDLIKELVDAIEIPTVFAGARRSSELFDTNAQLRSRVTAVHSLEPFDLDARFMELRGFILSWLEQSHPPEQADWLSSEDLATRIFYATDGMQRQLALLLNAIPVWGGEQSLSPELRMPDLAQLFRDLLWEMAPTALNPFGDKFVYRRLNRRGEPYWPTPLDGDNHRDPS
ncbi:TniB family NTP-binding protein [Roseateles flavus]|uniref:TniB family NTP-binding protein n=1 Tax=Roseateles flavus TaxID=3149041 RepID=A0ABV0G8E1_9BURK